MGTKVYDNYQDLITFNRNSKGTALRPIGYGDELVVNGTFDTDTTGWTGVSATLAAVSGQLQVTDAGSYASARQVLSTTIGSVYSVKLDIVGSNINADAYNGSDFTATAPDIFIASLLDTGSHEVFFVAEDTSTTLSIRGNFSNGSVYIFDNISVKEVLFDRDGDPLTLFLHPAGVPRIEYDADRNLKGLLIEPTAENLIKYDVPDSRSTNNVSSEWTFANLNELTEINNVLGPDGVIDSARECLLSSASFDAYVHQVPVTAGSKYTVSAYVKLGTATNFALHVNNTAQWSSIPDGYKTFTSADGLNSDTFTRISITFTAPSSNKVNVHIGSHSGSHTQQSPGTVILFGFQLEAGSIATSYMPTTGSTFTRDKDDASMTNVSGLIGQKEGTLYVEVDWRGTSGTGQFLLGVSDGTDNNRIQFYKYSLDNFIYRLVKAGGSNVFDTSVESSTGYSGIQKFAFAYADGDFELYRNGSSKSTGTGSLASLATLTDIDLGQRHNAIQQANMHIRAVQIIPRRLSDAQLIELTS